jgi:tetratricopeptide (TPR) repeat protein
MNRALLLVLVVVASLSAACTPTARWGNEAFYSAAHRSYVIAAERQGEHPEVGADAIVLFDPVSGDKLVCREDVLEVLAAHATAASDVVELDNAALASGLLTEPVSGLAGAAILAGLLVFELTMLPAYAATDDAQDHLEAGEEAVDEGRYEEAKKELMVALAADPALARTSLALYHLGRAADRSGDLDLARRAYVAFLRRAVVPAEEEFERAESWLDHEGALEDSDCASRSPIEVVWP